MRPAAQASQQQHQQQSSAAGVVAGVQQHTTVASTLPGGQQHGLPPPPPMDQQARTWETSVNIAIEEMKDFREDVAPVAELYSEFTTSEGRVLFECTGLTKSSGIDLMDCPLDISLKLCVRRRMPQGAIVLWHVVLPMPLISKHLLGPPHEWQTWIGLLPNTMNLDAHPPDVMFTQSVHLISRPEFPKLRLRFKYYNPEHQNQIQAKLQREDQECTRRKADLREDGKKNFEELQSLIQSTRGVAAISASGFAGYPQGGTSAGVASLQADEVYPRAQHQHQHQQHPQHQHQHQTQFQQQHHMQQPPQQTRIGETDKQRLALSQALHCMSQFREQLGAVRLPLASAGAELLPPLSSNEVLNSSSPDQLVQAHGTQLRQRLRAVVQAVQARPPDNSFDERLVSEGLHICLSGMVDDDTGSKVPRNATGLAQSSVEQIASIQHRYPNLWEPFREVSALSKERAALLDERTTWMQERAQILEKQRQLEDEVSITKAENSVHRRDLEQVLELRQRKDFDKMLAQQHRHQQMAYETELSAVKCQLEEAQQREAHKDVEVSRLRSELSNR